ncbi:peptidyl-prolyl cis-trans isomerase FKBP16-3, chloroplastic isoform X2 [Gossypium hirsutum]|uniref:Peptidyl-prolyl cis-trans isomerase FKBP16-3, chloroplastic isoform X2 n=1 Tax=Gossypium hirsutum TaxID=3635 RepID=A0ABM2YTP7_GOSHI|nr:peptidyl-prolyl cis-trans isomerase FKBP16-3, chloroplastic-like isoform X2 [Gossypium hirsutum]
MEAISFFCLLIPFLFVASPWAQAIIVRSSSCKTRKYSNGSDLVTRRDVMGLLFGVSIISLNSPDADGADLPPEEKPKLCDDACEKELEKLASQYQKETDKCNSGMETTEGLLFAE